MRWLLRKFDSLAGTVLAAIGGLTAAQAPVFVQQYLQRLGGHVDEAHRNLVRVTTDDTFTGLAAPVRFAVEASARDRFVELESQRQAIAAAVPALRPVEFLQAFDPEIAAATLDGFEAALPLDPASLIYGAAGIVAAWLLYEVLKLPFLLARRPRASSSPSAKS